MKILIDDGMQVAVNTGIGKYTKYLYKYLRKNKINADMDCYEVKNCKKIFKRLSYTLHINSPKYIKKCEKYDIVHFTNYAIPIFRSKRVKYVSTIHDLVSFKYPKTLPFLYRFYSRASIKYALKHSDMIFTVSNSVKSEIIKKWPKYENKIVVAYPGLYDEMGMESNSNVFSNDILRNIDGNYFLFIGTIEYRKNIDFIIKSFLALKDNNKNDFKLILAGKPGYGYEDFVELVNNSKYKNDIIFTGFISDEDCCLLYKKASAYIFPSVYEGFGSTQLECMKHHTPLLLSNIPTNVEVSYDYGLFFDLEDSQSLTKQMLNIVNDDYDKAKKNMIADKCLNKYKWDNVIKMYISAYQNLCKIKICHVIGDFINGGVESVILNYFSNMNLSGFDVHIIGHGITIEECANKFIKLGFCIHNVTPKRISFFKNVLEINAIMKREKFDIVHSHMTEWACVPMIIAYLNKIKVRINHSHMAENPTGLIKKMYYGIRIFLGKAFSTDYFACGIDAGIYLFGLKAYKNNRVHIINNAVDKKRFSYSEVERKKIRDNNNITDNDIIIGHVGRFFTQKNHLFLINIFDELLKLNNNYKLYLFGDGELFDKVKAYVKEKKLDDKVFFMGVRQDINKWYQAMDLFLLPSLYEGLPVVGVEAQMSGLPCYFSDAVTREIEITKNAHFLSLNSNAEQWAKYIDSSLNSSSRLKNNEIDDKFDIVKNAGWLENFYKESIKR